MDDLFDGWDWGGTGRDWEELTQKLRIKQWVAKWSFSLSRFYSNGLRPIVSSFNRLATPFSVEREI